MSLQLHRPDGKGGLEQRTGQPTRTGGPAPLAALGLRPARRQAAQMANPEMNPTSTLRSILFWLALAGRSPSRSSLPATARLLQYPPVPTAAPVVTAAPVTAAPAAS